MTAYAELQCASHFSFLRGASSAEELFAQAAVCGHHAVAITDRNSLAGIVRAHEAAKVTGVRLIVGCRLILVDGTDLLVYPTDRPAYARLCRLLSLGKARAGKANCELHWADVAEWSEGLIAVLVPDAADDLAAQRLRRLRQVFGDRAYTEAFATKIFSQLEGFGSYGFPESHAASFALIAYASSWLKCWHPDVFCAALLNAQPMGFYATAQIVRDAQEHGVEVRPVSVNASRWDCTLEAFDDERFAVRLGLRMARGLHNTDAAAIVTARADRPFADVDDVWRRADAKVSALERLAEADAFRDSLGLARREASWAIKALRDEPLPLFAAAARHDERPPPEINEAVVRLKAMTAGREVVEDYRQVGLSLRDHPVSFLRADLTARKITTCQAATAPRDGRHVRLAGLVLVRQKPGSAKGVMFITLEDRTAIANLVIWPSLYEKQRRLIAARRSR